MKKRRTKKMLSNDLDDKYYELEEAISILEMQIKESKDKEVISILEDCKDRLQEEFDEIKDDTESIWEREKKDLENEYWRSVI
jgi:F0F1-type ATP synthase membrane subunit b/b'